MAQKYLCIPAISVPAFSRAGNIVNAKCSCLLPENTNMLNIFQNPVTNWHYVNGQTVFCYWYCTLLLYYCIVDLLCCEHVCNCTCTIVKLKCYVVHIFALFGVNVCHSSNNWNECGLVSISTHYLPHSTDCGDGLVNVGSRLPCWVKFFLFAWVFMAQTKMSSFVVKTTCRYLGKMEFRIGSHFCSSEFLHTSLNLIIYLAVILGETPILRITFLLLGMEILSCSQSCRCSVLWSGTE